MTSNVRLTPPQPLQLLVFAPTEARAQAVAVLLRDFRMCAIDNAIDHYARRLEPEDLTPETWAEARARAREAVLCRTELFTMEALTAGVDLVEDLGLTLLTERAAWPPRDMDAVVTFVAIDAALPLRQLLKDRIVPEWDGEPLRLVVEVADAMEVR